MANDSVCPDLHGVPEDVRREAASVHQALVDIHNRGTAALRRAADVPLAKPDAPTARAHFTKARRELRAELRPLMTELEALGNQHPLAKIAGPRVLDSWRSGLEWFEGVAARTIEYLELPRRCGRGLTAKQVAHWIVHNRAPETARARARESHGVPTRRRGSRRRTTGSGSTSSGEDGDSDPEPPAPISGARRQGPDQTSESIAALSRLLPKGGGTR